MNYLRQKASNWVTLSVLAGGLVSAMILFWVAKVEGDVQISSVNRIEITGI